MKRETEGGELRAESVEQRAWGIEHGKRKLGQRAKSIEHGVKNSMLEIGGP